MYLIIWQHFDNTFQDSNAIVCFWIIFDVRPFYHQSPLPTPDHLWNVGL